MDTGNPKNKPFRPVTPQTRRRRLRQEAAYAELVDLHESGEGLADATARCAAMGMSEAEALVSLNEGSMTAPRLTSAGIADVLRFRAACANYMAAALPDPKEYDGEPRIAAEPILDALRADGYAVLGEPRRNDGRTHAHLAHLTGIHRRTIGRICDGTRSTLSLEEAEAISDAIDHSGRVRDVIDDALEATNAIAAELEEIYNLLWTIHRSNLRLDEEWYALADEHLLYDHWQCDDAIRHLPYAERREKSVEWFQETQKRPPRAVPDSLRARALRSLNSRRERDVEDATRAEHELPPPARITASYVRDLTRRARDRELLDPNQQPRAYQHGEALVADRPAATHRWVEADPRLASPSSQ
jgi:hypothetical protein